jgi:hypothetical protein
MFSAVVVGAFIAMGFCGAASASTFVWKDPVNDFAFSFPDSWTLQTNDVPTTRVRIAGPIGEDFATCRVKAEKDGRAQIYPKRLMTTAVKEKLDREFWENEVAQYDNGFITHYYAPASLGGQGDATAIRSYFVQDGGDGKMNMYSTMIGSIYGDMRYTVSCSSKIEEFKKYAPVFSSIMSSVELASKYHPYATGYYRNFLADQKLMLPRTKPGTIYRKSDFFSPSIF